MERKDPDYMTIKLGVCLLCIIFGIFLEKMYIRIRSAKGRMLLDFNIESDTPVTIALDDSYDTTFTSKYVILRVVDVTRYEDSFD